MSLTKAGFSLAASIAMVVLSSANGLSADQSQASLQKEAKITEAEARKIARSKVDSGTIKSSELEKENGKLIWSLDITRPKTPNITEIQIDAKTGKIVSIQTESPSDQAKEARSEK
jgi:uncharacterized membrane protein YkoI